MCILSLVRKGRYKYISEIVGMNTRNEFRHKEMCNNVLVLSTLAMTYQENVIQLIDNRIKRLYNREDIGSSDETKQSKVLF